MSNRIMKFIISSWLSLFFFQVSLAWAELPKALEINEGGKELDKRIFEDKPNSLSWKGYYIYDDEFYVCIIYNFDTNHLLECVPIMVVPTAERDYRK